MLYDSAFPSFAKCYFAEESESFSCIIFVDYSPEDSAEEHEGSAEEHEESAEEHEDSAEEPSPALGMTALLKMFLLSLIIFYFSNHYSFIISSNFTFEQQNYCIFMSFSFLPMLSLA